MLGLTTTRRLRTELAAARAEIDRQQRRADAAEEDATTAVYNRQQLLRQLAGADAANRRLYARNRDLTARAAVLERRVARLLKVGARLIAARDTERQRADHLQQRLDDAMGLNTAAVIAGRNWQRHREDGGRRVAS
ncbi:hypothetical protein ACH4JS_26695 [Streptomyces sp. NPDC017638]|uniref:hypothetical protein n=1 Tax=Streptomyces sp. NPDC017638 TaxID=3365004 RepID=UPI0037B2C95F